ncbi:NYN domain-containing protein [Nocardioides bigeumensis]|uniref:NYN domain-containing protein n=1 Tax=Nocardioides bigeumensis TaxID=433657 RepID=A0ABP5KEH9_9ACTN
MDELTDPLAVLIDADNTSPKHAGAIIDEAAKYGRPTVRRAYGDWTSTRLNGWKKQLNSRAIQPMQQFAHTSGKNSTDSALIIDAMDLLYAGHVGGFVLVSSDSDFTRLATRLQESGKPVYGVGGKKTPEAFQQACTQFIYTENIAEGSSDVDDTTEPGDDTEPDDDAAPALPDLRQLLTRALGNTAGDDGWSGLGAVGQYLGRANAAFDPRSYGHRRLSDLVKAQDFLEVRDADTTNGPIWVRVRQQPRKTSTRRSTAKKAAKKS